MTKGFRVKEVLINENPRAELYAEMDDALIGICREGSNEARGVYSYIKYVETLIDKGLSEEQAVQICDDVTSIREMSIVNWDAAGNGPIIIDDTGV
jgi:hypothetical protein